MTNSNGPLPTQAGRNQTSVRYWKNQIKSLEDKVERLEVQLAGCGVAALGGTDEAQVAKPDSFGWSSAYQSTLDLRRRYDQLMFENEQLERTITNVRLERDKFKAGRCTVTEDDSDCPYVKELRAKDEKIELLRKALKRQCDKILLTVNEQKEMDELLK